MSTVRMVKEELNHIFNTLLEEVKMDNSSIKEWSLKYFESSQNRYKVELDFFEEYLSKESRILEIGSLPCHMHYILKRLGYNIEGIDIYPERMKDFIIKNDLSIKKGDIEQDLLPYEDNIFDFVLFSEVFEHLRVNPIASMNEICRVMKPMGYLFLATPNFYSLRNIKSILKGKGYGDPYAEYSKLSKIGHMGHVREYSSNQVRDFLKHSNLQIVKFKKTTYYHYYGSKALSVFLNLVLPFIKEHQLFIAQKR